MEKLQNLQIPSPLLLIKTQLTIEKKINLYIKRDDLIHPLVSGNKWRKLKYNLSNIKTFGYERVITFGGPFSNHIHALAAACKAMNVRSTAFIRGELDFENPTLKFCESAGMELISITREEYNVKENGQTVQEYIAKHPNSKIIPEGGSNELALMGVAEIMDELTKDNIPTPDFIVLSCGTGGTTAGLLISPILSSKVLSYSALKSEHLYNEILSLSSFKNKEKLTVITDYHFGGYAKWTNELIDFMQRFEQETNIPLDHIYNGKAMFGLMDMITKDHFKPDTTIVFIHTGGLQGKRGLDYLRSKKN